MKFLFLYIFILFFIGCSNDIDTVKDGYLTSNHSRTVGDVFDKWSSCKDVSWKSTDETFGNYKVVIFTCNVSNIDTYFNKIKRFYKSSDIEKIPFLDIKSIKYIVRFNIYDDKSFIISGIQQKYLWSNDRAVNDTYEKDKFMKLVYSNSLIFDINSIVNKQYADIIVFALKTAYSFSSKDYL